MVFVVMNRYSYATLVAVGIVLGAYFINFYLVNGQNFSDNSEDWGALGAYFGGFIGPFLSFIAVVLLINSLDLQNDANKSLRDQLKNSEKTERFKSFESLFINLLDSQRELLKYVSVNYKAAGNIKTVFGVEAVVIIEDAVHEMRQKGFSDQDISDFLDCLDEHDSIYNILRAFTVIVRLVSDKLSETEGFGFKERRDNFRALINFTNFSQLRLIMMAVQFIDCYQSEYLKGNADFNSVLSEVGLNYKLY